MNAGTLRHKVLIQTRSTTPDEYGGQSTAWSDFAVVFASVEPLNGRELFAAQAVQNETTTRITIRYMPGIVPAMRAVFQEAHYNILTVIDPDMRHRELQLMCATGVVEG